jgi:hypothetical protein
MLHTQYYDDLVPKLALGLVVLFPIAYFYVRHRQKIFCERSYPSIPAGKSRGFQFIVRQTAQQIETEADSTTAAAAASDVEEAHALRKQPADGIFQVHAPAFNIVHKKSGDVLHGNSSQSGRSILSVTYHPRVDKAGKGGGGWTLQGTRRGVRMDGPAQSPQRSPPPALYAIEEGLRVASTGKAYWVEKNSKVAILVVGTWRGDTFDGEWLSSTGKRGPYSDCTRIEKDDKHLLDTSDLPVSPSSGENSLNKLCREAAVES